MPTIFLSSHTIRLIDKNTGEMLSIDNFHQGADLLTIFDQYLNSLRANLSHDPDAHKIMSVSHYSPADRTASV